MIKVELANKKPMIACSICGKVLNEMEIAEYVKYCSSCMNAPKK